MLRKQFFSYLIVISYSKVIMLVVIHAFRFNNFFSLSLTIVITEWLINYFILELKMSTILSIFEESNQESQFSVLINKYLIFKLIIVEFLVNV